MRKILTTALLVSTLGVGFIAPVMAGNSITPIEIEREKIENLEDKISKLEELSKEARQKVAEIDELIGEYKDALAATTKKMTDKFDGKLEQLESNYATKQDAYANKLKADYDLSKLSLEATEKNEEESKKLLVELGTSGEEVKKLTDAVSVSEDGNLTTTNNLILALFNTPQIKEFSFTGTQDVEITLPKIDNSMKAILADIFVTVDKDDHMNIVLGKEGGKQRSWIDKGIRPSSLFGKLARQSIILTHHGEYDKMEFGIQAR